MHAQTIGGEEKLSPWWRRSVILTLLLGFSILIWMTSKVYKDAPPIPGKVVSQSGETIFTGDDVRSGQQVFLKYGLMENGSLWGHGAYLGPDFSAQYLHALADDAREFLAKQRYQRPFSELSETERVAVKAEVTALLKQNRYDPASDQLTLTDPELASYQGQREQWAAYFSKPQDNGGLPAKYIQEPEELQRLTAFFAWTAWASSASRPNESYSYTNNFPYDPAAGNQPTAAAVLWSALSLVALLGGTALVLLAFGKFDYLGWKGKAEHVHPQMLPGEVTASQQAVIKYFVVAGLLLLAQTLVGGATAHYRADPGSFYGVDISSYLPSHILRTWHLQFAIFWIATAYVAGALFLGPALSKGEPAGQVKGVNTLFAAILVVAVGSLLGEWLGVKQLLGDLWFWLGHQGWEYLDLGRAWQLLLAAGLVYWLFLLFRSLASATRNPEQREMTVLFMLTACTIPLFYLPALFFGSTSHYSVVDTWRFWIIHLWVEGFFEFFVTVMVATVFCQLGIVSRLTATRVIYLDAILYFGGGLIGTAHHWYWTGQSSIAMALGATFSALEVVPLTLLTLDAWDFIKLSRGKCDICGKEVVIPHKWTFYFLMAVGFWNFVGAGIFGFLINLPIVSYFEVGTILTPNHGHAAMMGVFGMLGIALMVFALRQVVADSRWRSLEKYVRLSFWGLNIGLFLMVALSLFPGGVLQLLDVLENGYWHARSVAYLGQPHVQWIEWMRLPGDVVFIVVGVLPLVYVLVASYFSLGQARPAGQLHQQPASR